MPHLTFASIANLQADLCKLGLFDLAAEIEHYRCMYSDNARRDIVDPQGKRDLFECAQQMCAVLASLCPGYAPQDKLQPLNSAHPDWADSHSYSHNAAQIKWRSYVCLNHAQQLSRSQVSMLSSNLSPHERLHIKRTARWIAAHATVEHATIRLRDAIGSLTCHNGGAATIPITADMQLLALARYAKLVTKKRWLTSLGAGDVGGEADILLSLAEAATKVGTSRDYLRQLIHRGKLDAKKVGRDWMTTENAVRKALR